MVKRQKTSDTTGPRLGMRLDLDLLEALERLAADDGRTLSGYVRRVLDEHVRQKGASGKQKRGA
ncbi:MAG: ribbon-helix-helix protein, CopG family [Xanthobacteraceae bacterium]